MSGKSDKRSASQKRANTRVRSLFLSQDAANNLASYQYHAGEYSWLDLQLNDFWLFVASCIPRWISPNMVTLTGLLFQLSSCLYMLLVYYLDWGFYELAFKKFTGIDIQVMNTKSGIPEFKGFKSDSGSGTFSLDFKGVSLAAEKTWNNIEVVKNGASGSSESETGSPGTFWEHYLGYEYGSFESNRTPKFSDQISAIPGWLYLYAALTFFLFQTLDAADGKHARNTKQSTPLGALFDHGCDACCMICSLLIAAASAYQTQLNPDGPGQNYTFLKSLYFIQQLSTFGAFFLCQWEHQHTGILPTKGVTEAQWCSIACLICLSFVGFRDWMKRPVSDTFDYVFNGGISSGTPITLPLDLHSKIPETVSFLGIEDNCTFFLCIGLPLPFSVCIVSFLRVLKRYYWDSLWYIPPENDDGKTLPPVLDCAGSIWDSSSGFLLYSLMYLALCSMPHVWAPHWMKITAVMALTVLYLSLRSIVSGLCSSPMRGTPRTLYPVYLGVFGLYFRYLYHTSDMWKSWSDEYFVPCGLALVANVILPIIEGFLGYISSNILSLLPIASEPISNLILPVILTLKTETSALLMNKVPLSDLLNTVIDVTIFNPIFFTPFGLSPSDIQSFSTTIKVLLLEPGILMALLLIYTFIINGVFVGDVIYNICRKLNIPFLAPLREPWNVCVTKKKQ